MMADQTICLNSEGKPWKEGRDGYNGFISTFRKARAEAGIKGVTFSDLHGMDVTRPAIAELTPRRSTPFAGFARDRN
jgi:hypothetical protein